MSRRVRVTVEGTAVLAAHSASVLRVHTSDGVVLWIDPATEGVTVEDVAPERVWTDGDVVQAQCSGLTYSRMGGEWLGWAAHSEKIGPHSDDDTTRNVQSGFLTVLRYQAGEQ